MKRITAELILFLGLLLLAATGILFVNLAGANPNAWTYKGETSPPANANPPTVTISSPERIAYATGAVNLTFHVSSIDLPLYKIYYRTDWQESDVIVYDLSQPPDNLYAIRPVVTQFPYNIILTGVPEGKRNITVYAVEQGTSGDEQDPFAYYHYFVNGSASVSFAIGTTFDITPPAISVLSLENKTYNTADIPLNFTVNEKTSQISYVLDGQENVTIAGNITLTDLPAGEHTLTVYAWDIEGNVGTSGIIYFTKEEPSPTMLVIAPMASVTVVSVGLLVYFKKRKH